MPTIHSLQYLHISDYFYADLPFFLVTQYTNSLGRQLVPKVFWKFLLLSWAAWQLQYIPTACGPINLQNLFHNLAPQTACSHLHDCQPRGAVYRIPLVGISANFYEFPIWLVAGVVHCYGGLAPRSVLCSHTGLSFRLWKKLRNKGGWLSASNGVALIPGFSSKVVVLLSTDSVAQFNWKKNHHENHHEKTSHQKVTIKKSNWTFVMIFMMIFVMIFVMIFFQLNWAPEPPDWERK